jgi:hypothetical protein
VTRINAYYRLCDVWFNSRPVELMTDHDIRVPNIMIHLVGSKGFTFHLLYYKPFHITILSLRRSHELHEILSLNLTTGLSSPQSYVKYDEFFETVASRTGAPDTLSNRQSLAGFWMIRGKKVEEDVSLTPVRDEQRVVNPEPNPEQPQAEEDTR